MSQNKNIADFKLEIKAVDDKGRFQGYASVFNVVDYGYDVIAPGAFRETLQELKASGRKLPMLWQHDPYEPIGFYESIVEDEKGLLVDGQILTEVSKGRDAYALLKAAALSGLSIGYGAKNFTRDTDSGIRVLNEVDLWEISLVTFPMNDNARIDSVKRARRGAIPTDIKQFETFLRDVGGFSKSNAKAIACHGFNAISRCDAEDVKQQGEILKVLNSFKV